MKRVLWALLGGVWLALAAPAAAQEGVWVGAYKCGQGVTGMQLKISRAAEPGEFDAVFSFYPLPSNPDVPAGAARFHGRADYGVVVLDGVEWIDRPANFELVNVRGRIDGEIMVGRIEFPPIPDACSSFALVRQ